MLLYGEIHIWFQYNEFAIPGKQIAAIGQVRLWLTVETQMSQNQHRSVKSISVGLKGSDLLNISVFAEMHNLSTHRALETLICQKNPISLP